MQLLAEEQPLDGVVVGEEGDHVLQEKSFAERQQLRRVVHLRVDVVRHDVADVDLKNFRSLKLLNVFLMRNYEITLFV